MSLGVDATRFLGTHPAAAKERKNVCLEPPCAAREGIRTHLGSTGSSGYGLE